MTKTRSVTVSPLTREYYSIKEPKFVYYVVTRLKGLPYIRESLRQIGVQLGQERSRVPEEAQEILFDIPGNS